MHSKFIWIFIHIQSKFYLSSWYLNIVVVIPVIVSIDLSVDCHWGHTIDRGFHYCQQGRKSLLGHYSVWGLEVLQMFSHSSSCTDMLKACWWTYWWKQLESSKNSWDSSRIWRFGVLLSHGSFTAALPLLFYDACLLQASSSLLIDEVY